jgi:hypothetical protein
MRWLILAISILVTSSAQAASDKDIFSHSVYAYFRAAEPCLKRKQIPRVKQIRQVIAALDEAANRFFPEDPETWKRKLFIVGLTEGGGNVTGVKADPDTPGYGFFHVKENAFRFFVEMFEIDPYYKRLNNRRWFKSTMETNIRAGILVGAAYLRVQYKEHDGKWSHAVCSFKHGDGGFKKVFRKIQYAREKGNKKAPQKVEDLKIWKNYRENEVWMNCVIEKTEDLRTDYCECLKDLKKWDKEWKEGGGR